MKVDPYAKPKILTDINPRGLVPALKHGELGLPSSLPHIWPMLMLVMAMVMISWGCYESTVLLEYLEDLGIEPSLLPRDPKDRAVARLWADHVLKFAEMCFGFVGRADE